jgi:hypothetical protein
VIFGFIQFRNLSTLVVSTIFCYRQAKNPYLSYNKDVVTLTSLFEFDTVMVSLLPYTYFKRFILTHEQNSLIYLRMYELTQLLHEKQRLIEGSQRAGTHSEIVQQTQQLTEAILALFKANKHKFRDNNIDEDANGGGVGAAAVGAAVAVGGSKYSLHQRGKANSLSPSPNKAMDEACIESSNYLVSPGQAP